MSNNNEEKITIKDKSGNPVTKTVEVPPDPQPQVLFETFNRHDQQPKNHSNTNNNE